MRLLLILLLAVPAYGRTLHWRSLDVQAQLDRAGVLHIVEEHGMVFDGDWNGGERTFDLRGNQRVEVHRLARVEAGREIELVRGDLDAVDHYELSRGRVIRWRARLPSDPPFEHRLITYRLEYSYENALDGSGDRFVLAHDFGLPEASTSIERFTLRLDFDPVWNASPVTETRTDLPPGEHVIVRRELVHAEGQRPPVYAGGPWLFLAFLGGAAMLFVRFLRGERATGRFASVEPRFDSRLIEERAEVVGAIWDGSVGPPEVAATLARMTQEKKITSRVDGKELFMRLDVDRNELSDYEATLVGKLFFDGVQTDTKSLRRHYRSQGVDFAAAIRPAVESAVVRVLPDWNIRTRRFRVLPHVLTLAASLLILAALLLFGHPEDRGEILMILVSGGLFGLIACGVAWDRSRAITHHAIAFLGPTLLLAIPSAALALGAFRAYPAGRMSLAALLACAVWLLAIVRLTLDMLKAREPAAVIARRKDALALRKYFIEQLRLPHPAIRDEWFPHLLAFGLGKNADRWFRAFGAAGSSTAFRSDGGSSSPASSAPTSWSGGGGSFGGAGATGSWALAATAIGAGVPQPSSSSGSSRGGSSSGGGGGGGW